MDCATAEDKRQLSNSMIEAMQTRQTNAATNEKPVIFQSILSEKAVLLGTAQTAIALAFLACLPTTTRAETELWGQVGEWSVFNDRRATHGCSMYRSFGADASITLGVLPLAEARGVYFSVTHNKWTVLKPSKNLDVHLQFGSSAPIKAKADFMDDSQMLFIVVPQDTQLFEEFAKNKVLHVKPIKGAEIVLKFDRAAEAISAMLDCLAMVTEDLKSSPEEFGDPFAKTPETATPDDPFAKPPAESTTEDPFAKPPATSATDDPFAPKP
ncbi:hypothetical protein [Agrobacterium larrymoorei]|uniref:hypothetical protein n=1 Tax=Agrobacterium larrymoorei TaxID=160699 RepID=UPI0030BB23F2